MPRSEQTLRGQMGQVAAALRSAFPPEDAASLMSHPQYDQPRVQGGDRDPRFVGEVIGRVSREPLHLFLDLAWEVRQLPEPDRVCVLLHVAHEHPAEAVARWLRCSPGTVRRHATDGLAQLARQLWSEDEHLRSHAPEEQSA